MLKQINDLQDFYYNKQDLEHLRQMDDRFHLAIYTLSQRPVLRDTLVPLHRKTQRYRLISIADKQRLDASIQEHNDIYKAITSGDAELASKLITEHISRAKQNMIARCYQNG